MNLPLRDTTVPVPCRARHRRFLFAIASPPLRPNGPYVRAVRGRQQLGSSPVDNYSEWLPATPENAEPPAFPPGILGCAAWDLNLEPAG